MKMRQLGVLLFLISLSFAQPACAQHDTLKVMAYNVLYYGDRPACQGGHSLSHNYLKTIVAYASPDILGLEKMAAIPITASDHSGSAPLGFADSILQFALNAAYAGRYAYCTYTNSSAADNMSVLFYDKQKLGFAGIIASSSVTTDFNTYKLYYRSSLADTVFLYVTLNHTESGSSSSDETARAVQITAEMSQIQTKFTQLPNFINMGDFNTHQSTEACYQTLVNPSNPAFRFYDPPFSVDGMYTYPADWDSNPGSYAACLTTSTRLSGSVPNSCGTSGGGKSWYDHIFISGALVNNTHRMQYIPHSYRTVGNDGNRTGMSVNSAPANTSAPAAVIDAVFQMSNKYPIMVSVAVDTSATASVPEVAANPGIRVINPVGDNLCISTDKELIGKTIHVQCMDVAGKVVIDNTFIATDNVMQIPCALVQGVYVLRCSCEGEIICRQNIVKR